jgi:hypothetical protein
LAACGQSAADPSSAAAVAAPAEVAANCAPGMACEPLPAFDWREPAQWMGPSADRVVRDGGGVRIEFDDREQTALVPHGQISVAPGDAVTLTVTVSSPTEQRIQMGVGRHPIDTPQERTRRTENVGPDPQTFTYTHTFRDPHPSVRATFALKGAYDAQVTVHDLAFTYQPGGAPTQ